MVIGSKKGLLELKNQLGECISNQNELHRGRFGKEHQGAGIGEFAVERQDIVSTRSPTR